MTGREDDVWAGIVNVEGKCLGKSMTLHSNEDYRGDYNRSVKIIHPNIYCEAQARVRQGKARDGEW